MNGRDTELEEIMGIARSLFSDHGSYLVHTGVSTLGSQDSDTSSERLDDHCLTARLKVGKSVDSLPSEYKGFRVFYKESFRIPSPMSVK
jgi:hypothetical protein|tara:strand:+ start:241 stop:507 length:267 start_codon:yes stop_codon:yes gene_type:complete